VQPVAKRDAAVRSGFAASWPARGVAGRGSTGAHDGVDLADGLGTQSARRASAPSPHGAGPTRVAGTLLLVGGKG
jgi:hypothetical protein